MREREGRYAPAGYPLRGWPPRRIVAELVTAGFEPVADRRVGDIALIAFAAGQFHLGLMGPASMIHAHAGLRRVVETPLNPGVPPMTRWRPCAPGGG